MDIIEIEQWMDELAAREEPESMQNFLEDQICNGFECMCSMPIDVVVRESNSSVRHGAIL